MNNKKNKSKSRGKLIKPPQTTANIIEKLDNIEGVGTSESINTEEEKVPEVNECILENSQSVMEKPKKPKRTKSKKTKEGLIEDIKSTDENVNTSKDAEIALEHNENIGEEDLQISPCIRKRKKKLKKHENLEENVEPIVKCTEKDSDKEKDMKIETHENVLISDQILPGTIGATLKDDVSCKKKKKKKHRHDSEISDKNDLCTLAFQEIIEPLSIQNEVDNSVQIEITNNDVASKDNTLLDPNQILVFGEEKKSKNKGIAKKHSTEEHVCVENEVRLTATENKNTEISENIESETGVKETTPKPRALIAKPVQKKHKTVSNPISLLDYSLEKNSIKLSDNELSNAEEIVIAPKLEMSNNRDNVYVTQFDQEEKDGSSILSDLTQISKIEQEQETSLQGNDDMGFMEVKASKNKKKRNKNILLTPDIFEKAKNTQSSDIQCSKDENEIFFDNDQKNDVDNNTSPEKTETQTIIIPDLIEYPRSTSQQLMDTNNNTVIQEIITPELVALDISDYAPKPIIQGSGESPEVSTKSDSITVNVPETIARAISSKVQYAATHCTKDQAIENIDIKSKMMEVNQDMEGLRLSIEKSLGELTALEKNDSEVDKEFEELFQSQTLETLSTDPECSLEINKNNCDIEMASTSTKSEKINENLESKLFESSTKQFKTINLTLDCNKDIDKINPLSLEILNVDLVTYSNDSPAGIITTQSVTPVCPIRRDKGKNKCKKRGRKEVVATDTNVSVVTETQTENTVKDSTQSSEKTEQKSESTQEKGKQQTLDGARELAISSNSYKSFEPIENFEDALTSSVDDINKTFEIIASDATQSMDTLHHTNPRIHIISPSELREDHQENNDRIQKQNPVSLPKNLLGHTNIPASSNETDYKKEKNKPPNSIQAKVKIKDSVEIEMAANEQLKLQTENKRKLIKELESDCLTKTSDDIIFKYSFRKVFLQNVCHVCKKDLVLRVPCKFCSLVFYCSQKHKDEDWSRHQSLCFAVSTIAHLKEQKHIYAGAQNIVGHNYRTLRMQMILSCEKILNRKLVPWEQEALLYPRICADVKCRQWKQSQLKDCEACGQVSYCIDHPEHLPSSHQRWCKSYALYEKIVNYQQIKGRLEPRLPSKVLNHYQMSGKINDVLGSIYEEKIDMDDIQYAALTQVATAPLTAAYCCQLSLNSTCANRKSTFTIHTVGAELPFEADSLNKWEIFFLHLRSEVQDLRVVMVGPDINSSRLPLELLGKIKLCENCQARKRRVIFDFYDNESYHDYYLSDGFVTPDLVCAFNPNIQRSSSIHCIDPWPSTINCILKQGIPFVLTSYTIEELRRDVGKIRECARVDFNVVSEIKYNSFCSVRPDRNFITDHEMPLLFKNYCFCILCGII